MIKTHTFDYTDASYKKLVAINDEIDPGRPLTIADFKHEDDGRASSHDAEKYAQRWLASLDGEIVGHAQAVHDWQRTDATHYFTLVEVRPSARKRGVGDALLAEVVAALQPKEPFLLSGITKEDRLDAIDWLKHRGFKQIQREPMSALDVQAFDAEKFAGSAEKFRAAHLHIRNLSELEKIDANYKVKLFDLVWDIIIDVPGSNAENREKPSYDYLEAQLFGDPTFTPEAWFVAVEKDSGKFVGTCNVHPMLAEGKWNNGLTGALRSHRRMGVATSLKMASIVHVKSVGGTVISTSNDENNPMYKLNLALGFEPRPALLTFER